MVLKNAMPGEYGESFGEWYFDCLNAEGYIAETNFSSGTKAQQDGYAAIYGYEDTLKYSRFSLYTFKNTEIHNITVAYSMCVSAKNGCKLSVEAEFDKTEEQILNYSIENDTVSVSCGENSVLIESNVWNRYVLSFDTEKDEYKLYINGKLSGSGIFADNPEFLQKLSFAFKSENFEDCYAIDDVALIY